MIICLFCQVLGKPVVLREWNLQGLPSDKTSVESAIAATTVATGKWPLLIDPQRRACRWLKHKGMRTENASGGSETTVPTALTRVFIRLRSILQRRWRLYGV